MKHFLNLYSVFVAKAFRALYTSPNLTANRKAMRVLDHYRSVRRTLPLMNDGNHWGNHSGSSKKSFYATQGIR
jgi:hypothetical protein